MRALLVLSLVGMLAGTVGGCASTRQALGFYKKTADQGVTLGGGKAEDGVAPAGSAGSETTAARPGSRKGDAKAAKLNLPGGLGGDKEHHAYTGGAPN